MAASIVVLGDLQVQRISLELRSIEGLEGRQRADWILLTVLVRCRYKVESYVIDHDVASDCSAQDLVWVLTVCHACDHASLLGKGTLLL